MLLWGDKFAEILAEELGINIRIHPAEWRRNGISAGMLRNTYIAKESDILIAIVAKDRTGGTEDTIIKFQKFYPNENVILL